MHGLLMQRRDTALPSHFQSPLVSPHVPLDRAATTGKEMRGATQGLRNGTFQGLPPVRILSEAWPLVSNSRTEANLG